MSTNKTTNLGMHSWSGTDTVLRQEFNDNFNAIDKEVGIHNYKRIKSGKDAKKIFTVEEFRRKSDNTLYKKFVLSGGTTPLYTTLTETEYAADGTTVIATKVYTLAYDADKDLTNITPN